MACSMILEFSISTLVKGRIKEAGLQARTEPVLFALVRDDDFYSLGCYAHGAWSLTGLLDLIHAHGHR